VKSNRTPDGETLLGMIAAATTRWLTRSERGMSKSRDGDSRPVPLTATRQPPGLHRNPRRRRARPPESGFCLRKNRAPAGIKHHLFTCHATCQVNENDRKIELRLSPAELPLLPIRRYGGADLASSLTCGSSATSQPLRFEAWMHHAGQLMVSFAQPHAISQLTSLKKCGVTERRGRG
jgi:hypothetical protein